MNVLNTLGLVLSDKARYEDAILLYRKALEVLPKLRGPDDLEVVQVLNNLGTALRNIGDFSKAELLLRKTLDMRRQALGNEHPKVKAISNLCCIFARQFYACRIFE